MGCSSSAHVAESPLRGGKAEFVSVCMKPDNSESAASTVGNDISESDSFFGEPPNFNGTIALQAALEKVRRLLQQTPVEAIVVSGIPIREMMFRKSVLAPEKSQHIAAWIDTGERQFPSTELTHGETLTTYKLWKGLLGKDGFSEDDAESNESDFDHFLKEELGGEGGLCAVEGTSPEGGAVGGGNVLSPEGCAFQKEIIVESESTHSTSGTDER